MTTHPDDEIKPADENVLKKYGKKRKATERAVTKSARSITGESSEIDLSNLGKLGNAVKYDKSYCELAFRACLLFGATDDRLAAFFGVSKTTLYNWIKKYTDFRVAVREGKEMADAQVAQSLYMSAIGYERDEIELKVVSQGEGAGSVVEKVPIKKYYPPNIKAATFWLTNRQPKLWREKVEIEQQNVLSVIKIGYGEQTDSA